MRGSFIYFIRYPCTLCKKSEEADTGGRGRGRGRGRIRKIEISRR